MKKSVIKFNKQVEFFKFLKNYIPKKGSALVHVISDILEISEDSVYRRMSGKSPLEFGEAATLCEKFNVSFDLNSEASNNQIKGLYTPLDVKNDQSLMTYTNSLVSSLGKIRKNQKNEILLSASCIPIFCLGNFEDLILFNFFSWNKNVYGASGGYAEFLKTTDTKKILKAYHNISDLYLQTSSTEIWSSNTVDSFLNLLHFHYKTGAFKDNLFPMHLCQQLLCLLEQIRLWTEKGEKNPKDTTFKLFIREAGIENTFALFKGVDETICIVKLFSVNNITIYDHQFCSEMESWLRNLMQQATLISEGSAVEKYKFFLNQTKKITDYMIATFNNHQV